MSVVVLLSDGSSTPVEPELVLLWTKADALRNEDGNLVLPGVKPPALDAVIDWCRKYKDEVPVCTLGDVVTRLVKDGDVGWTFEVTVAAHALGARGLLNACCETIANMMRGKTPAEVRERFKLPD